MDIYNFITLDNKKYNDLTDLGKDRIDRFIKKIKESGLAEKLSPFILVERNYDITRTTENGKVEFMHSTNLPKDLSDQLDYLWYHVYD